MYALNFEDNINTKRSCNAEIIPLFGSSPNPRISVARSHIPHAAEPVRSLDDIRAIQNYFLSKNQVRNYAIFTVGVCTGLRVSDLFLLKLSDVLNEDLSFKDEICIKEKKTGKLTSNINDSCLITEAIRISLSKYLSTRNIKSLDEPLFYSRKAGRFGDHSLDPRTGWRIFKQAQIALNLPYNMGSHTMRKSFVNIAVSIGGKANVDMTKLISVQHMLRHSDYRTTMTYLRLSSLFTEKARINVSDFVLGKTDKNDLTDALFENPENEKLNKALNALCDFLELNEQEV